MALPVFPVSFSSRKLIYALDVPTFQRDFAGLKTLDHGTGPAITFTRASGATYFDADGVLQTASNDVARFDHDPATGSSLGLLHEEARTNLLVRSEEFDNASWTKQDATITANAIVAPNGTTTADKIVEDTDTGLHRVYQTPSTSAGAVTLSFYAKAAEKSWCFVRMNDGSNVARNAYFDISSGAVGSVGEGYTTSIAAVGNGWFRCVATLSGNTSGAIVSMGIATADAAELSYTGDGTSGLYIWGAQLEQGAFPTSYIPTTTATATRAADAAVVTPISSFYNQAEGTVIIECSFLGLDGTGTNSVWRFALQPNDNNNFLRLRQGAIISGADYEFASAGSTSVDSGTITINASQNYKLGSAFASNDFAAYSNGGGLLTDSSVVLPAVAWFGVYSSETSGHIRKIAYWPKRLSNTLLQQLTT